MFLFLPALACASSDESGISDIGSLTSELEAKIPALLEEYGVPGAAIAVVDGGDVAWSDGFGLADVETRKPVTTDTVFQVASVSKSVTAWGAMRLVENGLLGLDTPVETYLTRWHLPDSEFDSTGVTVRRLLSHTAGLSLHGYPGFPPDQELPSLEASLSGDTNGPGDVRLVLEPGSSYQYSGGGYTLLQLLIEEVTGQTFSDYMQSEVLEPLRMESSSFEWPPELRDVTATAYGVDGGAVPNFFFTAKAAAGLYTTSGGLARFVAAGMEGPDGEPAGRGVLRPETVDLLYKPVSGAYALGHGAVHLDSGVRRIGHSGGNIGWRSFFHLIPEEQIGIVILTNSDNGDTGATEGFRFDVFCIWARWAGSPSFPECPDQPSDRGA